MVGVTSYSLGPSHRYRSWTVMGERRLPQARVRLMWPQPARGIVKFNRFHTISTLSLFEINTGVEGKIMSASLSTLKVQLKSPR